MRLRVYTESCGDPHRIRFFVSLSVWVDTVIQRIIEFLISIPTLPLWMGLTAALPPKWPALRVYFEITVILSILGETALSFIGLGLKAPVVSWGVLLTSAQNFRTVALSPWLLIPVLFVVATVMTFMFLGDGLRDAAGPYK